MSLQLQGAASTRPTRPFQFSGFFPLIMAGLKLLAPIVLPLVTQKVQQVASNILSPAAPQFGAPAPFEEEEFEEFSDEELDELLALLEEEEPGMTALPVPQPPPFVRTLQPAMGIALRPGIASFSSRFASERREAI